MRVMYLVALQYKYMQVSNVDTRQITVQSIPRGGGVTGHLQLAKLHRHTARVHSASACRKGLQALTALHLQLAGDPGTTTDASAPIQANCWFDLPHRVTLAPIGSVRQLAIGSICPLTPYF